MIDASTPKPTTNLDCVLTDRSVGLPPDDRKDFVLSLVRVERARMQLAILELDHVGIALRCGVIHPAQAVALLREMGAKHFLYPPLVSIPEGAA